MANIELSKVNEMDIDAYANIIHEEMGYTHEEARLYLNEKNFSNMLKIKVDDKPVGFINYTQEDNIFYINDFDVEVKQRRKGYGCQLLKYFELEVKNQGGVKVWLHVNVNNETAIKFYQKYDYKIMNRIDNYYAENFHAFIIEKSL